MARRVARRAGVAGLGELNLTPLLDIIFNLLFFFLLATTIRERQQFLEITIPASTTAEARQPERTLPEITLTREGTLYLDGEEVDAETLLERLQERRQRDNVDEVIVNADAGVVLQQFIDVTDICRQAGILRVSPPVRPPAR